jgi:hypothetical protein
MTKLYDTIWKIVGTKVGYGIDCDVLTDRIIDAIDESLPKESHGSIDVLQWNKCVRMMRENLR